MRNYLSVLTAFVALFVASSALAAEPVREWTFLIYLNGNNSLDSFGPKNIIDMEKVGSSDQVNIVVQWASAKTKTTKRLLIKKSSNSNAVTSPVVQNMGKVDMGDYKTITEFVKWGADNYPAKKYFLNVWDHGGGWHKQSTINPRDISWDDLSGHYVTTEQLATALSDSAKYIGHKIDLYGSDACLMAMAEVAGEMADSVSVFAGSQETEPGAGWPYDQFLKAWVAKPTMTAQEVGQVLTREYTKSYQGGSNGNSEVTFSTFDMANYNQMVAALTSLSESIQKSTPADLAKLKTAMTGTQNFAVSDYGDLLDFIGLARGAKLSLVRDGILNEVEAAASKFIIANAVTTSYKRAHGLSLWMPSSGTYGSYSDRYEHLKFNGLTHWNSALKAVLQ